MHPKRKQRLTLVVLMVVGVSLAAFLILKAMEDNLNLFYSPRDIAASAPGNTETIRVGGMVVPGSVVRSQESLAVTFDLTDGDAIVTVSYAGILPDLFAEDEAAVATGIFDGNILNATQVLAKHDENYTPPEVADAMKSEGEY